MCDTKITELSDKVVVIQSDGARLLNDAGLAACAKMFEDHGFKVIWLSL